MSSGVDIFNLARQDGSEALRARIPSATETNIQQIANVLFDDGYTPMLNEFVSSLVNRIVLTIVRNKSFSNPLAMFKKGTLPLGTDIQEIYTNPATAEPYELSEAAMAKILTITDPDTHTAYYRRNRQDLYTKTVAREALQAAFKSWEDFGAYVDSIAQSLYSGNYIDEFNYTKALIDGAVANDKVIKVTVTEPTNESTAKKFLKTVRALTKKLSFPSTEYNAYTKMKPDAEVPVTTWTDKERIVFITTADVMAELDVDALAGAFNLEKADFLSRVVEVDKFEDEKIMGVICDESWLQIYDNLFKMDEQYNGRVMATNFYLHAWGTYAISPFANAVALVTE